MTTLDEALAGVDALRDEIVAFHQAFIRFETVNTGVMPTGNETLCCQHIQGYAWTSTCGPAPRSLRSTRRLSMRSRKHSRGYWGVTISS